MGKPVAESRTEISYGAEFLRWFSEEAVRIDGRWSRDPSGSGRLTYTSQRRGRVHFFGGAAGRPGDALNSFTTAPSAVLHTFTSPL